MTAATPALLDSRDACIDALRQTLLALPASATGPQELIAWSADFADWPLSEPKVLDAITLWMRAGAYRLTLIARDFTQVERHQPRFTAWRKPWLHRIASWQLPDAAQLQDPAWLWSAPLGVRWMDTLHWRGLNVHSRRELVQWRQEIDVVLQQCEAAWPFSPLGL